MDVNYLKLNDKVYAISEIQANDIDINSELKEFYEQRHGQLADEFGEVLTGKMNEEWSTQIAHLRKLDERGNIKVPNEMFNKPCIVFNGVLMPVRVIVYSPDEVSVSMSYLRQRIGGIDFSMPIWNNFREGQHEVILTIRPLFSLGLVMCFDKKANKLYTPLVKTFHTMLGGNICTGNHKASDFWKLTDERLQEEMNKINTFSPATSTMMVYGLRYDFRTLINNDTIIDVRARHAVSEGGATWRV